MYENKLRPKKKKSEHLIQHNERCGTIQWTTMLKHGWNKQEIHLLTVTPYSNELTINSLHLSNVIACQIKICVQHKTNIWEGRDGRTEYLWSKSVHQDFLHQKVNLSSESTRRIRFHRCKQCTRRSPLRGAPANKKKEKPSFCDSSQTTLVLG